MTQYLFSLDNLNVSKTRARHSDTDYVSFGLTFGTDTPQLQVVKLGDLGHGDYDLASKGLRPFGPFSADQLKDPIVMAWTVVNNGHGDMNQVMEAANQSTQQVMLTAADDTDMSMQGNGGSGVGWVQVAEWIGSALWSFLNADCDGIVAADTVRMTAAEIASETQNGVFTKTGRYPGTDSAVGCGENSLYFVAWSITPVQ